MRKVSLVLVLIAATLTSCSTSNRFACLSGRQASSFGKRKYTKGYFADAPASTTRTVALSHCSSSKPKHAITSLITTIAEPAHLTVATKPAVIQIDKITASQISSPAYTTKPIAQTETVTTLTGNDDTKSSDRMQEANWVAVIGCAISIVGIILTAVASGFTILSVVFLGLGTIVCVYSLFLYKKIYLTWVAVIGLSLTILLLALLLL